MKAVVGEEALSSEDLVSISLVYNDYTSFFDEFIIPDFSSWND